MTKVSDYTLLGFVVNGLSAGDSNPPNADEVFQAAENESLLTLIGSRANELGLLGGGLAELGVFSREDISQALASQASVWDSKKFFVASEQANGWLFVIDWIFNQLQSAASDVDVTWGS